VSKDYTWIVTWFDDENMRQYTVPYKGSYVFPPSAAEKHFNKLNKIEVCRDVKLYRKER